MLAVVDAPHQRRVRPARLAFPVDDQSIDVMVEFRSCEIQPSDESRHVKRILNCPRNPVWPRVYQQVSGDTTLARSGVRRQSGYVLRSAVNVVPA